MEKYMLWDRVGCENNDDRIQRWLVLETTLNFTKAYESAVGIEVAAKTAVTFEGNQMPSQQNVNKVCKNIKTQGGDYASAKEWM